MGVVWKAEDTVLGRTVAVKVLPADLACDERRRRMFLDEARLASSLNDAHIVQVYDFAREGDLDFIVMEYVEGKPLGKILKGRSLSPDRVAEIGHQVARALSRAHKKGLLHRDLKPSNILITPDGDAKVVDFGLATLFSRQDSTFAGTAGALSEAETLSALPGKGEQAPVVAGTLPYMSPEQVRGEDLDARSDIFSLGVVLYEMTTGQRPFSGATFPDVAKRIQEGRPRPVHELLPAVPLDLERSIQKALSPHRGDRYQTMDDLAVDLRKLARDLESGSSPSYASATAGTRRRAFHLWTVLAAVLLLVGVAVGVWTFGPWRTAEMNARTILILPMEVRGQTEEADYVGRAFAETLAVSLAQSEGLNVLAVPEAGEVKAAGARERAQAALGMGAGRLLTGSLTRSSNSIHVTLSLVETRSNRILWGAQSSDADGSLPALAASLSQDLSDQLGGARRPRYEYWFNMTGSGEMAGSPEWTEALGAVRRFEIQAGLDATQRLLARFPGEREAHVLRVRAVANAQGTLTTEEDHERSLRELERIDPRDPTAETYRCLFPGGAEDGEPERNIKCMTDILAREDLSPAARGWALRIRALNKGRKGDTQGALADVVEATSLDPSNHYNLVVLGGIQRRIGDLDAAAISLRKAVALAPGDREAQQGLAVTLEKRGKWREAAVVWANLCVARANVGICAMHAQALLKSGDRSGAQEAARKAAALLGLPNQQVAHGAYDLACVWALTGDRTEALRLLRRSVDVEPRDPKEIITDPDLAALRDDPTFKAIVADAARRFKLQTEVTPQSRRLLR